MTLSHFGVKPIGVVPGEGRQAYFYRGHSGRTRERTIARNDQEQITI